MTRKQWRLAYVLGGLAVLACAALLILNAFRDSVVFFYSPTEVVEKSVARGQVFRLGGLVEDGSLERAPASATIRFRITDLGHSVQAAYTGILPDLFREGQGVVAEGALGPDGVFVATTVLAKHDENYMPPEVAEALKKSGRWQEGGAP